MWNLLGRRQGTAGIDLGSTALKAVSFSFGASGPRLSQVLCLEGTDHLDSVGARAGRSLRSVAVAMPPNLVDIQYFVLPPLSSSDLRSTVAYKMVGKLDYDLDDACIDYTYSISISRKDGNGEMQRVIGFACRRSDAQILIDRFAQVGLKVEIIDVVPMALMNIYRLSAPGFTNETMIGVDIGHETANFVIIQNGILLFYRHLPFSEPRSGSPEEIRRETVKELAYELKRTTDYCQVHITPVRVERVVLSGGGALQEGLAEDLERELGTPCQLLDCFPRKVFGMDRKWRRQIEDASSPRLAVAAGLALRFGNAA